MSEFDSSEPKPATNEPRIAIAPNVFVHMLEPGGECLYIFNIYPVRDSDPQFVVVPDDDDEEIEIREEVARVMGDPFARSETIRLRNGVFETEEQRLEFIQTQRFLISAEHGVPEEEIVVTEINKREAQRFTDRILNGTLFTKENSASD